MKTTRILHLEDIRSDADLVKREITKSDLDVEWLWVSSRKAYEDALATFDPDIVLSDHSLPSFTSVEAFRLLKNRGSDIPFIVITATMSEEFAVTMMKEGITDYLLKDRLQRLPAAIHNALERARVERERNTYQVELARNEKRFRALIENSHDVIGLSDLDLNPIYASPSYARITGWTLEMRTKEGNPDLVHPDDERQYREYIDAAKTKPGKYIDVHYRIRHRDGHFLWMEGTIVNTIHEADIKGFLFNLRDVSARKATEDLLKSSKANMAAIIENSSATIYSLDRQFRYLTFNQMLQDSLKQVYGLDIHVGDVIYEFLNKLDPEQAEEWKDVYTQALSGSTVEFVKEFHVGDYHSFVQFFVNPIREGDFVTGLSCFAIDITKEKMAERSIARNEARFRALIENNYDAILVRGADLSMMYASPSASRLLGMTSEEFSSKGVQVRAHPDDIPALKEVYDKALANPAMPLPIAMRVKHKDGHYLWVEGVITNMLHNENVLGIVSNYRDITARKEAEIQKERIAIDLVERNKNLEQYAFIVSHNLRGPVANILGVANLLEYRELSATDRKRALTGIFSATRKLDEVLRDLNEDLAVKEKSEQKKETTVFQKLVADILTNMDELVVGTQAKVITDFEVKEIAAVRSYLHSIFYNLISNSIKYRRPDVTPIIHIESRRTENGIKLVFRDNGLGIDLNLNASKIFGLYMRFHPEHADGKGMGLFLTKTQVEHLGGRMSVESEVGVGTVFTIEL